MPDTEPTAPAPGWYRDDEQVVRWWDGEAWTEQVRQEGRAAGQAEGQGAEEPAGRSRTRLVVGALLVLVVFVAVAAATTLVLDAVRDEPAPPGDDPAEVVRANFAALRAGDCAAYLATFSAADQQAMGEAFCRQTGIFGSEELGELTVESSDVDGDAARVTGTFTDGRGEQPFAFDLVREDGRWVIAQ